MSSLQSAPMQPPARNPLALPLIIVSFVALAEGLGLVFLVIALARGPANGGGSAKVEVGAAAPGNAGGNSAAASVSTGGSGQATGFVLGKVGQRVESGGFGITVERVNHEPMYKELADWGDDGKYVALLILVENNTGGNADLLPASFRVQDDKGFGYRQLGVKLSEPKLSIAMLGNGEKVRGYLDFVVPKTAKGLKLIYSGLASLRSQPIHVDLGE